MAHSESAVRPGDHTLSKVRGDIRVPAYDRSRLTQNTVHIGVGGFHRAHQLVYLDDLLGNEEMERWGECGIGLLPSDVRMRDVLKAQDCLYTVVERSAEKQTARIIGSMVDYLYAPEEGQAVLEKMAAAECKIVSLTITEGGYFVDEGSRQFAEKNPAIQYDLLHPGEPTTSLGYLAEALHRRRQRGLPPFTLMSCDNLQENGQVLKRVLLAYCGLRDAGLQRWVAENAAFPNSMVDRITPATTTEDISFVTEKFGLADGWPVVTEPFLQWVIEDEFCSGRPRWEEAGAQLVSDVAPYEIMKVRLLNGSHVAMAYLGAMAGYTYVHEIMQDQLFAEFIFQFMETVTPVVPEIPGTSIAEYKSTLMQRFANPTINDQVTRIASQGSVKMPNWLLPSVIELLHQGRSIDLLCLVIAAWIRYLGSEHDEHGHPLTIIEDRAGELVQLARSAGSDARSFVHLESIFGKELPASQSFCDKVQSSLRLLSQSGTVAAMRAVLRDSA
jgi:mannitol 2-dehydrogenase